MSNLVVIYVSMNTRYW